eukprot:GGOE01045663.1.p1 GENE.GGOE01045663.1~~GGOE01045663.1.p1  ORF type:complete len:258 (-),score=32.58 GGOE01045663.1:248-1021(-)
MRYARLRQRQGSGHGEGDSPFDNPIHYRFPAVDSLVPPQGGSPASCTTASSADFRRALRTWAQEGAGAGAPTRAEPDTLRHHPSTAGCRMASQASARPAPERNLNRRLTVDGSATGVSGLRRFSLRPRQHSSPDMGLLERGCRDLDAVLRRRWAQHQSEFDAFATSSTEVIFHSDVPWPDYFSPNDVLMYVLDKSRRGTSARPGSCSSVSAYVAHQLLLRPLLLRWHPDKFQQHFGERLAVSCQAVCKPPCPFLGTS